jgi:hypothetical protein
MVAQAVSMVVASTVVTFNAVNIHVENLVAVSTVGNLRAVNVLARSLAANIPVESMVAASTVNAAVVTIATERERQRYAQAALRRPCSGELFSARGAFDADFKDPIDAHRPIPSTRCLALSFRPPVDRCAPFDKRELTLTAGQ